MDREARTKLIALEHMLDDESVKPTDLPLSLLEYITNTFSDDKQIGRGGFAVVYKGMLKNGPIAVKKLFNMHLHENKFEQEVECLMKAKHKNVVRFLGYCSDTQGKVENYNGKLVMADVPQRLLCFEYLPKGSLYEYITDAFGELKWTQCYQIIKGICTGLHYLHENRIVHLDLKPANILLDNNMVPKIADFGLSRCFDEKQSHVITSKICGSLGYLAPEVYRGRIMLKSDIYSLGIIIIEILTREKMYPEDYDVLKSWGNRFETSHRENQVKQFHLCVEIWKECTEYDPKRRPNAQTIVRRLQEMDIAEIDMTNLSIAQEEQHDDGCNLIGAIGRELSLKCLVRLSRSEYGSVASLSRDFRSLVRSGLIYRLRRRAGVAEHWIYLSCNITEWNAYDPDRQRWIQVPKMPMDDETFMCSDKESLAVGTDLLVFGRSQGVERTVFRSFRYSILTNSWIRTDPVNHPRCLFGSASVGHKACLAGGSDHKGRVLSSVDMYDSVERDWEPLPSMNRARMLCSGVFMDGKLFVIGGKGSNNEELTCGEEYDFELGSWRVIDNMCEGLNVRANTGAPPLVAVVNNELYGADYIEKNVKKYDKQNNRWITLGKWPENVSSVNGWGIGFKACGDQLIIIGGPKSYTANSKVGLYSCVPDRRPPVWNLIARCSSGIFLYNAAVMSC